MSKAVMEDDEKDESIDKESAEEKKSEQIITNFDGDEGDVEKEDFEEGALLGEDDEDSDSSSEMGSEEMEGEEDEAKIRKRKSHKKKKKRSMEEEEEDEEGDELGEEEMMGETEEGLEEEEAFVDEFKLKKESIKNVEVKAVISGFDIDMGDDRLGEEEVTESSESEPTALIREPFYAKYLQYMKTYAYNRRLNNFLHKKMAEYFKKRKMEHVMREMAEHLEEAKMKYGLKLFNYQQLISNDKKERATVHTDLKIMKQLCREQILKAQTAFAEFIDLERNTGIGLINSKTGKEISDKIVDKLLGNQISKANEVKDLRLKHIKIRNAVADKHAAIRAMDRIGENYTLIEFEQMKIENAAHVDKVEEKDDELAKLRRRCSGAIQCLAHVREKCSAVEMNIRAMTTKLEDKDLERIEAREMMNELKQKRDYFRREAQRLKEVNGLLTKDKLLIDMEDSIHEVQRIESMIESRTQVYNEKKEKLKILRENYEKEKKRRGAWSRGVAAKKAEDKPRKKKEVKKKRSSITMPMFSEFF